MCVYVYNIHHLHSIVDTISGMILKYIVILL